MAHEDQLDRLERILEAVVHAPRTRSTKSDILLAKLAEARARTNEVFKVLEGSPSPLMDKSNPRTGQAEDIEK